MTANGYFRVAAAVPSVNVADCKANARSIIELARESATQGALLTVFPEMAVTGYTCADLFHNSTLLSGASAALCEIAEASLEIDTTIIVGAPISIDATLYNCGIVINNGKILAAIPKTYVPNYNEFYEKRWWVSGAGTDTIASIGQHCFPVSSNILVEINGVKIGTEICEDLWTPIPPSTHAAMHGAQILVNLSASDDVAGKYDYLISLLRQQSARCLAAYVYSSAGYGESSTDLVFDGKAIIAENGTIL
ncbi:MAG: NAD(+) synthase, partial [Muribaculaceae bacterium]|nr:NAD(+) synthase [Muribaculaceae bacterium]